MTVYSGAQGEINKQVVVSTAPTQSVINVSSNRNHVLLAPIVGLQVQYETMMLKDEAIASIIMNSARTIVENNGRESTNTSTLSTHNESSGLSLGEKERLID